MSKDLAVRDWLPLENVKAVKNVVIIRFVVAKSNTIIAVILVALLNSCTLNRSLDENDLNALTLLQSAFAERYSFKPAYDLYLEARSKSGPVDDKDAEAIARVFFLDTVGEPRKNGLIVYINFYNADGSFKYQLYWSYKQNKLGKADVQVY